MSNSPFRVNIERSKTVAKLKNIIRVEKWNTFNDVDPDFRSLTSPLPQLQVGIDLNTHDENFLNRLQVKEGDTSVQKLLAWKLLFNYWQVQPSNERLHILVDFNSNLYWYF
jgi:hypothetical protein